MLLPEHVATVDPEATLVGIDFYQAFSLCRLLGVAIGGDPELFRLPFGCELELAAFGVQPSQRYHAAAAVCSGEPERRPP